MKRYCQTLSLRDDKELIKNYVKAHKEVWPVIKQGIRQVGILDMQIYIYENKLFMIVETVDDFDWIRDNEKLAKLEQQKEWEAYVAQYQQCESGQKSHDKWKLMDCIFKL